MSEESLKQENKFLKEMIRTYYQPEIEQLKSIIKKVRKYIEIKQELNKMFGTITLSKDSQKELLEILDKGE